MSGRDEPMPPGCMKCRQVTGNASCFPDRCVFYDQRNTAGTKAANIATLDRIRRGMHGTVYTSKDTPS